MLVKKILVVFAAAFCASSVLACTAPLDEALGGGDEHEDEPHGETNDELRSSVSCQETTETAYSGGKASTIKVIKVGGKAVSKATGHAFLKMQAAADTAGVSLSISSGFRTMSEQKYFYNCYLSGKCNNGNLAAKPGFSNHQSGYALDLSTSSWLAKNAGKFGFERTVASETWHYEYHGADPGGPCSTGSTKTGADTDDGESPSEETGLPAAGKLKWVSPQQNGVEQNGFTVQAHAATSSIVKVVYSQGTFVFGQSTDAGHDFSLDYTFKYLGDKTLTVKGYDASGTLQAIDNVDFTLNP
ncbi:MAG: D-alanyl-D-alanine carboxypeptidase [Labilithrix sp.]|nr:D-alanyl-D-alanine carboxypeptidase [Labilithrix sp.]